MISQESPSQPSPSPSSSVCYFTYIPAPSTHFSVETPRTPLSAYTPDIVPDPRHPLLASSVHLLREPSLIMDSSKILQLQTAAAHSRPAAQPLQNASVTSSTSDLSSTTSSSSSSSSSLSEGSTVTAPTVCCSRCRRTETGGIHGMVRFGTNLYYCSHCASITGYNAG